MDKLSRMNHKTVISRRDLYLHIRATGKHLEIWKMQNKNCSGTKPVIKEPNITASLITQSVFGLSK
jgi:hypothetical protein